MRVGSLRGESVEGYLARAERRIRERRAAGVCVVGGGPTCTPGGRAHRGGLCLAHYERTKAAARAKYVRCRREGLCVRCGGSVPARPGKSRCAECAAFEDMKRRARRAA